MADEEAKGTEQAQAETAAQQASAPRPNAASQIPAALARIAGGVLVLGGMTTGVFFLVTDVIGPGLGPAQQAEQIVQKEAELGEATPMPGEQYVIEEIVVNPAGTRGKRFLRLGVALETMEGPEVMAELEQRKAQIRDLFISEFSSRSLEELTDPTVREEVRVACLDRINGFLVSGDIASLYFTDYVLQ